jgi:plastocyanin
MFSRIGREDESRRRWVALAALMAAALLAFGACGGGDDGAEDEGTTQADDGGDSGGGEPAAAGSIDVTTANFAFDPAEFTVETGAEVTVTLTNEDDAPHTFTSDDLGAGVEADAGASSEGTFTAPEPGEYEFHCEVHPDMKGTVTVE